MWTEVQWLSLLFAPVLTFLLFAIDEIGVQLEEPFGRVPSEAQPSPRLLPACRLQERSTIRMPAAPPPARMPAWLPAQLPAGCWQQQRESGGLRSPGAGRLRSAPTRAAGLCVTPTHAHRKCPRRVLPLAQMCEKIRNDTQEIVARADAVHDYVAGLAASRTPEMLSRLAAEVPGQEDD